MGVETVRAMVLERPGEPLMLVERALGDVQAGQVCIEVSTCGVCRTDLHLVDGELPEPSLPIVPGHQIVGEVSACGTGVMGIEVGQRVGVPWLGWTCGRCAFCAGGQENLCETARFTGYQIDGGFADRALADHRFCFPLPQGYPDLQAAPLLCAGLIGYRALTMAGDGRRLGLYGIGAAAHIILQVAVHQGREVYAFTRSGDRSSQAFARELGAVWAGSSTEPPPERLDAAILFAPVGALVPASLKALRPGGTVVCAGIHMSDIPSFPYELLWHERHIRSVANLTRQDGHRFLSLAAQSNVQTHVTPYPLSQANEALEALRRGAIQGAVALVM